MPLSSSRAINSTLRAEGPRKPQLPSCERSHRGQLERGEDHRGPQKGNSTAHHRSEWGVCVCVRARVCATQTSQEQRGRNSHTHALKRRGATAEHEGILQPSGRSPRQQLSTVAHPLSKDAGGAFPTARGLGDRDLQLTEGRAPWGRVTPMAGSGAPQLNLWGAAWGRVPCGSGDHLLLECFVVISGHRPWAG